MRTANVSFSNNMKLLLCFSLAAVVVGFSPVQHVTRLSTAHSMSMLDDWKTFFSPDEVQHRKQDHEREMEEMRAAQKEVLDRRRNPSKMKAYHQQEEKRHERFDRKHDVDIEQEIAKEWIVGEKPLAKTVPKTTHSVLDDWKNFFSKPEADHRRVQHHLEILDTADAEQQRLERNRDPAKMKAYKQQDERRHQRMDKQHEVEVGFQFAEEQVDPKMKEGQDFIGDMFKNLLGKKKQVN